MKCKHPLFSTVFLTALALSPAPAQIGGQCPRTCVQSAGYSGSSGTIPTCVVVLFFFGNDQPGSRPTVDPCSTCSKCTLD